MSRVPNDILRAYWGYVPKGGPTDAYLWDTYEEGERGYWEARLAGEDVHFVVFSSRTHFIQPLTQKEAKEFYPEVFPT